MSTFSAPTSLARPTPVTVATVLLVLDALRNFASIEGLLSSAKIPAAIVAIEVALGVAEIVAAVGLWGLHKQAVALAIIAASLSLLISVIGIFGAESTTGKVTSVLGLILGIAVIVSVALPTARRAFV